MASVESHVSIAALEIFDVCAHTNTVYNTNGVNVLCVAAEHWTHVQVVTKPHTHKLFCVSCLVLSEFSTNAMFLLLFPL